MSEAKSPRTSDTTYGKDYWETLDNGLGYQDSTMWEDISHTLKELVCTRNGQDISGQTRAVDVGCAGGYLVKHLRRRGLDAWGLDFSDYALMHTEKVIKPYLRWYDLSWVDDSFFGQETFDLLTCFETLEHIDPDCAERAVRNLWSLLKPGGLAVLTICVTGQPGSDDDPTHVNVVSRDFWENLFSRIGWKPVHDMSRQLRWFWLFSQHKGVFVLRRP